MNIYTHLGALAIGAVLTFAVQGWRHDAEISRINAEAEKARATAAAWVIGEMDRSARVVAEADKNAIRTVSDANKETDRLRDCIDRGDGCGLRVKVVRAACLPAADQSAGMDNRDSESAELGADARRAYFTLRQRIPVIEQALKVCISATQQAE